MGVRDYENEHDGGDLLLEEIPQLQEDGAYYYAKEIALLSSAA